MEGKIRRQERINSLLRKIVSSFIKPNIDSGALVTVMRVEISKDLRLARIFISVFPEEKEKEAIDALKRKARDLHRYLKTQSKLKFLPSLSFEINKEINGLVAKW